jgi:hypothetical protein
VNTTNVSLSYAEQLTDVGLRHPPLHGPDFRDVGIGKLRPRVHLACSVGSVVETFGGIFGPRCPAQMDRRNATLVTLAA